MFALAPALTALAATLAVNTTPTPQAQYPIGVTSCNVSQTNYLLPEGGISPQLNSLQISFVNHAPVAAKDVKFVVRYAGASETIDDRGTFSNNVAIEQSFDPSVNLFGNGAANCSVASVTFADGTTWQQG
jgi:hypothetical protein